MRRSLPQVRHRVPSDGANVAVDLVNTAMKRSGEPTHLWFAGFLDMDQRGCKIRHFVDATR